MADVTSINGLFEWLFGGFETNIMGSIALVVLLISLVVIMLLFLMRANKFVVIGFMGALYIGLTTVGYTYLGWIGGLAFVVFGLLIGFLFIKILG